MKCSFLLCKIVLSFFRKYLGESVVYTHVEAVKDFIESQTICETSTKESDLNTEGDLYTGLEKISASKSNFMLSYLKYIFYF